MKKTTKCVAAAALAVCMALPLSGCGLGGVSEKDAKMLVMGNMDEIYHGTYDQDYLDLVDTTEEDAQQNYEDGLDIEADYFADYFDIDTLDDDLREQVLALYREIYSKSVYSVESVSKIDSDTFAVKMTIEPLDIFELVTDDFDDYMADFYSKYDSETVYNMTDEEYAAYDAEWAQAVIDLCNEKLPEMGYDDPVTKIIQVTLGDDDYWSIDDDDFSSVDEIIITYP